MDEYTIYDLTVETASPLHIGTGRTLLNQYDYVVEGGQTRRLNEDAILDALPVNNLEQARRLASAKPADLVEDARRGKDAAVTAAFYRYTLRGAPRSRAEGAVLREQIKTPFDLPYLPGSSVKGALRTALAWKLWEQRKIAPNINRLGQASRFAANGLEKEFFGSDPNHDFLRALQVSDSAPTKATLIVANARVLKARGLDADGRAGAPIEMEAIASEQTFHLTIKVDNRLFDAWAQRAGLATDGRTLLNQLPRVVQEHAQDHIRRELDWFRKAAGAERIVNFYNELAQARRRSRRCLMALGWGTGWGNKTLGSRLQADPAFMERVLEKYSLTRGHTISPPSRFPTSRRVITSVQNNGQDRIAAPFGWCLITFEERK